MARRPQFVCSIRWWGFGLSMVAEAKDLIVVVADIDAENAIEAVLHRRHSLGIRNISYDIRRHVQRDPGCRTAVDSLLRPVNSRYNHALVVFDWEGSGAENDTPEEIEGRVESALRRTGWGNRSAAVVIKPELEAWVWSDSPHVTTSIGWQERRLPVREWIKANTQYWPDGCEKPTRPKEALEACLREIHRSASPALFESIASSVSLSRCTDRAFGKFKSVLRNWFCEQD